MPGLDEGRWLSAESRPVGLEIEVSPTLMVQPARWPLRVVTFNVEYAADTDAFIDAFQNNPELARGDVFMLQEIEAYPDEDGSRTARIASALGMNYIYAPARHEGAGTHGQAILSRYELGSPRIMELADIHTVISARDRIAVAADLHIGDEVVEIVNVHLNVQLNLTQRIAQLDPPVRQAAPRTIVAGDLNSNPYVWADGLPITPLETLASVGQNDGVDDYMEAMGYAVPTRHSGPTHDAHVVHLRLDSIFTRGLESGAFAVERGVELSDHYPLWLDVQRWVNSP